jgi:ankyrin repeat protein
MSSCGEESLAELNPHSLLQTTKRSMSDILYLGDAAKIAMKNDGAGWTKLQEKVFNNDLKVEDIVNLTPAEIDHRDEYGQTAMWIACNRCSITSIEMLKNAGANMQQKDNQDRNLLHAVATATFWNFEDCEKVVGYLLKTGADPLLKDIQGKTPIDDLYEESYFPDSRLDEMKRRIGLYILKTMNLEEIYFKEKCLKYYPNIIKFQTVQFEPEFSNELRRKKHMFPYHFQGYELYIFTGITLDGNYQFVDSIDSGFEVGPMDPVVKYVCPKMGI